MGFPCASRTTTRSVGSSNRRAVNDGTNSVFKFDEAATMPSHLKKGSRIGDHCVGESRNKPVTCHKPAVAKDIDANPLVSISTPLLHPVALTRIKFRVLTCCVGDPSDRNKRKRVLFAGTL